jgi:integrase/recombinase XerD
MELIEMSTLVDEFLASFPFAESTMDSYRRVLSQLPDTSTLTAVDLIKFVSRPDWDPNTRYTALCACRKFIAWRHGRNHPALNARIKRVKPKPQRVLSSSMALQLLASFNPHSPIGSRDLALAALMLDTGLRCSEICRIDLADLNLIERRLQVIVKGGQWRAAVFSQQTAMYISAWLSYRPGDRSSALFVSMHHTHRGLPLTREGLQGIVKKWGASIGIKLSPHDFRRTFATLSTIFGAPSRVVQVAGRWSSLDMVEHYTASLNPQVIEPYLPVSNLAKVYTA